MLTSSGDYIVKIADVPIAYASIDPCLCCTGRVQIVDIEKNKKWIWSWEELKEYSKKEFKKS
jgi:membrane-bound hydrogenase subunit alpha